MNVIANLLSGIREVFIRRMLCVLVGFFCYCYTLYGSDFAEWRIKFQCFNFPIFIGELLLFLSLLFVLIYYLKRPAALNKTVLAFLIPYVLWVILKASMGYAGSGPLALRNAALFYYPLFALVGYVMLERSFYNSPWRWAIIAFLFLNLYFAPIIDYFVPVYSFVAFGLCWYLRPAWLKYLGLAAVVGHLLHSKFLFCGSRSHMIGVVFALVFLAGYFLFGMLKMRGRTKVWLTLVVVGVFTVGLSKFADQNALRSMLTLGHLSEQYKELDAEIQKQKKDYIQRPLKPQIYFQNRDDQLAKSLYDYAVTTEESFTRPGRGGVGGMNALQDSAQNFMITAMDLKQSSIHKKADVVYEKARVILEQKDVQVDQQYKKDLDQDIQKLLKDSDVHKNKDIEKALENFSAVLRSDNKEIAQQKEDAAVNLLPVKEDRSLDIAYNNIFFRIFIWRDMLTELKERHAWWGVSFGHPQRSISIEILDWARIEWQRDGWITPHNSFLHMIYRGGIVGILCVSAIIGVLTYLIRGFLKHRSVWGGLLVACLMYWIGISNFLVFLELPYNAIPFWTFFGMTVAYYHSLEKGKLSDG